MKILILFDNSNEIYKKDIAWRLRKDISETLRILYDFKRVEIIEAYAMTD